jgi:Fic family protein
MANERITGRYVECSPKYESFLAWVPSPLPPTPPLQLDDDMCDLMEKANRALGRLDGVTSLLPDTHLFTYFYVRKEAVVSSQIEGTQSSLQELLLFEMDEAPGAPIDDVQLVSSYVKALDYGIQNIRSEAGLPLSLRLLREMHGILLEQGRGSEKTPGEFRKSQNWVGGTKPSNATYVPPPLEYLDECLDFFEKYLYDQPTRTPVLIKAALGHVQFESIHPFQDGNGRLGRLLITLLLCSEEALKEPMLYLSLFFKIHRDEYYAKLQNVRKNGDWESWLRFFLTGVLETSQQAVSAAQQILRLFDQDRRRINSLGQQSHSVLRVHDVLTERPVILISSVSRFLRAKGTQLSEPTVYAAIKHLQKLGIVREVTGKKRFRVYVYDEYMKILDEGTKPLE